jgi:hypothetical protein
VRRSNSTRYAETPEASEKCGEVEEVNIYHKFENRAAQDLGFTTARLMDNMYLSISTHEGSLNISTANYVDGWLRA